MQNLKSAFGIVSALVPVIYCCGLLYYFVDTSGSLEEARAIGLGPTVLGLGIVGFLFSIPAIVKAIRLVARLLSPGSGGGDTPKGGGKLDPDAAIARYLAKQSAAGAAEHGAAGQGAASAPDAPRAPKAGAPSDRPSFGRRR